MELSNGRPEVTIALIDGPVATDHPDLAQATIRELSVKSGATCARADSIACLHGTLVAGMLSAGRDSAAPAICPGCTLLVRPIFAEASRSTQLPNATPEELGTAIIECVAGGAQIINLSAALRQSSPKGERLLNEAMEHCSRRGVIIVAAAGNQGSIGSSSITRHPWVIPVVACDLQQRPIGYSNLGSSIGRQGLRAPGDGITSLSGDGTTETFGGTSAAAPFVTGALGLLFSEFPDASAAQIKFAITRRDAARRQSIVPPLLDAWSAYQTLRQMYD